MSDVFYISDLAKKLNTTEASIRSALQKKSPAIPPAIRLGRRVAFRVSDYDKWLEEAKKR